MVDFCISECHLFHYFLRPPGRATLRKIQTHGLRSLTDQPDQVGRLREIEAAVPGHFERLYRDWAEPILQRPYGGRSGVFLTPIDFRHIPHSPLEHVSRVVIPLDRIEIATAVLTYDDGGHRVNMPLNRDSLIQTRARWPAARIATQFAVDPERMFFFVPQVVAYQSAPVPVNSADIDLTPSEEGTL